ncbi:MAG TPA: glycine cleavage T C-terminal barrel domain-containing protein [Pyrinomonadaceae bacterium]|nr:glycine cleavage T C-terminal barrel domain-containing protein [Pyrinomonadaceae bacterium]
MIEAAQSRAYSAVRDGGAGLIDLSTGGRIVVGGSEAVMFLNGLITNDMKTLAANSWMPAAFPNVQGRLLAAVRVLNLGDRFLIDTEGATHSKVLELLSRFTLAGDFRVTDATQEIATLSAQGQGAAKVVGTVLGDIAANLQRGEVLAVPFSESTVTLICATHTAEAGFDLFVSVEKSTELQRALVDAGAVVVDEGVSDILRIEAGIPRYGLDMDETTVLSETNLDDAISFTKGCYIGQEIIVRIMHRGHVAKKLTGLIFDGQEKIESGTKVFADSDQEIGRVTSSTYSDRLQRALALAYVKYDYLAAGTKIKVGDTTGVVAELPFVRGSWY